MAANTGTGVRRTARQIEADVTREIKALPPVAHRPEPRCRVCQDESSRHMVNKMLAHLMGYADILSVVDLSINPNRAKNNKISYRSIWYHAQRHFNLDDPAGSQYRKLMERRSAETQRLENSGVERLLNAFGYLEVVAQKGYETTIKDDTYISPTVGLEAILKLHALTRQAAGQATEVELRQRLAVVESAVKDVVPPEYWNAIIERIEESEAKAVQNPVVDAEVVDDYDDYGEDDDPYIPTIEADADDSIEGRVNGHLNGH